MIAAAAVTFSGPDFLASPALYVACFAFAAFVALTAGSNDL